MRSLSICILIPLIWSSTSAADTPEQNAVARLNETTANLYAGLKSFVCEERIERFKGTLDSTHSHHIDVVTAAMSFENGTEEYTDIRQNAAHRSKMASLSGAWSEGEFGSLVRQTDELLATKSLIYLGEDYQDGIQIARYAFDVAATESPWHLVVSSREYRVPFQTEIWVSGASGQIARITRRSLCLPATTGIRDIVWTVTLRPTRLLDNEWILPSTAEYSVSYLQEDRREWNHIRFDHYRRYGSEVAIRFGDWKPR